MFQILEKTFDGYLWAAYRRANGSWVTVIVPASGADPYLDRIKAAAEAQAAREQAVVDRLEAFKAKLGGFQGD